MEPTTKWICDVCGKEIESPEDGWLEWVEYESQEDGRTRGRDVRVVHHTKSKQEKLEGRTCQFDQDATRRDGGLVCDGPLGWFLGPDGLMRLLSMMEDDRLPVRDVIEVTRRLHMPGYEKARFHFSEAVSARVVDPSPYPGCWELSQIEAVIKYAETTHEPEPEL